MKIKEYNAIIRSQYPKWNGWKILDFYNSINISLGENEISLLTILEDNFYLTRQLESKYF